MRKIVHLNERLDAEREIRAELEAAKRALVAEVEELSESLFEEAGSMVAKEAKARSQLELVNRRLAKELEETRDRLDHQTAQLDELRRKLLSMSVAPSLDLDDVPISRPPGPGDHEHPLQQLRLSEARHYTELLFPDGKFVINQGRRAQGLWTPLVDAMECGSLANGLAVEFREFKQFVEAVSAAPSSQSTLRSHPYFRKVNKEMEGALSFPCKSSSFAGRVVDAMLANECIIERLAPDPGPGPDSESPSAYPPGTPTASVADTFFTRLTNSVTSLPDTLLSTEPGRDDSHSRSVLPSPPRQRSRRTARCTLCELDIASLSAAWRMRLSPKELQWRLMDEGCRDRLVAVGDFIAFIRHIRAGLYRSRPLVDLFGEQLHLRRNVFYVKTGSLGFFVLSDFEQFWRALHRHNSSDRAHGALDEPGHEGVIAEAGTRAGGGSVEDQLIDNIIGMERTVVVADIVADRRAYMDTDTIPSTLSNPCPADDKGAEEVK